MCDQTLNSNYLDARNAKMKKQLCPTHLKHDPDHPHTPLHPNSPQNRIFNKSNNEPLPEVCLP